MVLNSKDMTAMSKIGGEAAVQFVVDNDMETEVLRWKLKIRTEGGAAQDSALMYIWGSMNGYDLGKLCREWIAYGCVMTASKVLDALTSETGEPPKPSFTGSRVEGV